MCQHIILPTPKAGAALQYCFQGLELPNPSDMTALVLVPAHRTRRQWEMIPFDSYMELD